MFSVSASATTNSSYHVYSTAYLIGGDTTIYDFGSITFTPNNGNAETRSPYSTTYYWDNAYYRVGYKYAFDDQSSFVEGGREVSFSFSNVYTTVLIQETGSNGRAEYLSAPDNVSVYLYYTDGTADRVDNATISHADNSRVSNVNFDYTPKKDVASVELIFYIYFKNSNLFKSGGGLYSITSYQGEFNGDDKYQFSFERASKEEGLLSGIWDSLSSGFSALGDKLSSVWSAITDGFANMGNKLTDVWNSIIELPSKLWALIEEGLTNLFVPSEQSMEEFKTKFETMLEEKYGAVWEVVQITFGSWENINASDLKNTISVPKVEIPLPDDASFSFGGEEVKVIPAGFETIADICKMMSGAFCTLMFINGLRKRYDEVMAVEK